MADLETKAIRLAAKLWPDHDCRIRVKRTRKGWAHPETREVTIPVWVMRSSRPGYATYYVAHELAHIHAGTHLHNSDFMESFKSLCPRSYWKYETEYKPRNARAAGIGKTNPRNRK